jgi:hypothetical protein
LDGATLNLDKFKAWVTDAVTILSDPTSGKVALDDDMDEIDRDWRWSEATMWECASIFHQVAALIPPEWDGLLTLYVTLRDSAGLIAAEPHPGLIAPDDFHQPTVSMEAPRCFTRPSTVPYQHYQWCWAEDPWGATDDTTRVCFVSFRDHGKDDWNVEYHNMVEFKRCFGRSVRTLDAT